jgi:hypothetical protein
MNCHYFFVCLYLSVLFCVCLYFVCFCLFVWFLGGGFLFFSFCFCFFVYLFVLFCLLLLFFVRKELCNHTINVLYRQLIPYLASCTVDREFEPRLSQTKDYNIGIWCYSTIHTT